MSSRGGNPQVGQYCEHAADWVQPKSIGCHGGRQTQEGGRFTDTNPKEEAGPKCRQKRGVARSIERALHHPHRYLTGEAENDDHGGEDVLAHMKARLVVVVLRNVNPNGHTNHDQRSG
jgi:hypothetical protein